jgi:hypothetical protein
MATLSWSDVSGTAPAVTNPKMGGLMKSEDGTIIAFVGTDPDAQVNVFSYDAIEDKYTIDSLLFEPSYPNQQGPVHDGQYRPTGIKYERKTRESCTEYSGHNTFHGLVPKEGEEMVPVRTYKQTIRRHIIRSGMWNVFNIPDPCNPTQKWDLFLKQGRFPLEYVKEYVRDFRQHADKFELQNLDWSGEYIRNTLTATLLSKVMEEVSLSASGTRNFSCNHDHHLFRSRIRCTRTVQD